jgi:hypothetical protein
MDSESLLGAAGKRGLTWIHVSDWHQKGKEFDRRVVRDALIEDIKKSGFHQSGSSNNRPYHI